MWYMCVTECYSAIKQSEMRRLPQRDGLTLSEARQRRVSWYHFYVESFFKKWYK